MSKAVYETNVYVSPDPSTQMDIVDMGLAYLTAHTSATVSSPSSQYAYDRIINAGGGLYFRIQIGSTTAPASVWISRGRIVNGEWVQDTNIYQSNLGPGPFSGYAVLININGGDAWDLGLYLVRGSSHGGAQMEVHIRCVMIKSSLNSNVYYAGCIYEGDPVTCRFPDSQEAVIVNNVPVRPYCLRNSYIAKNVPAGKLLLYPSLLSLSVPCLLGVPTIGNQKIYYPSTQMDTYMERVVGGSTFISLGNVSIRSV